MENHLTCLLLISLVICGSATGDGSQKKRPTVKKGARSELSSKSKRSANSASKTIDDKDAQINSFVAAFDSFTIELVGKVEAVANPAKGVEQAQKFLEARRAEIRARFDAVKCIGDNEVKTETKKNLQAHFFSDGVLLGQLQAKYGSDPEVLAKLKKLTGDFLDILRLDAPCPKESLAQSNCCPFMFELPEAIYSYTFINVSIC